MRSLEDGNGYRKVFVYVTPHNSVICYPELAGWLTLREVRGRGRSRARGCWQLRKGATESTNLALNTMEVPIICSDTSRCNARERC
jgi:hypothetical protein